MQIKKQLIFMWLFVFAVYLPFAIYMILRFDVTRTPISLIGWSVGGLRYLIIYITLTLPFCLYLVYFFNKHFLGNRKFIKVLSAISSIFVAIGAFIPLRETGVNLITLYAHTIISVGGSILLMLTILYALILHALTKKHKILILSLYGIYVAALLTAFYILYTAALFQLMASLSFFLILLFLNTMVLYRQV